MPATTKNAELEVLNRFSYMLDEYSVQYLTQKDSHFRSFVESLYGMLDREATSLVAGSR